MLLVMKKLLYSLVFAVILGVGVMCGRAYAGGDGKLSAGQHMVGAGFGLKITILPQGSLIYDYVVMSDLFKRRIASWTIGGYFGMRGLTSYHFNVRTALRFQLTRSFEMYVNLQSGLGLFLMKQTVYPTENLSSAYGGSYYGGGTLKPVEPETKTEVIPYFDIDYAIGMRYSFTPHWGMYCEMSPGFPLPNFCLPYLSLGVAYRI